MSILTQSLLPPLCLFSFLGLPWHTICPQQCLVCVHEYVSLPDHCVHSIPCCPFIIAGRCLRTCNQCAISYCRNNDDDSNNLQAPVPIEGKGDGATYASDPKYILLGTSDCNGNFTDICLMCCAAPIGYALAMAIVPSCYLVFGGPCFDICCPTDADEDEDWPCTVQLTENCKSLRYFHLHPHFLHIHRLY